MKWILLIVLALAGCDSGENVADMSLVTCPPGASQLHGAHCNPAVDKHLCRAEDGYEAHCQCDGWWEVDQVLVCCDADGGTSRCQ